MGPWRQAGNQESVPDGKGNTVKKKTVLCPRIRGRVGGKGRGRKKTHEGDGQDSGEVLLHGFPLASVVHLRRPRSLMGPTRRSLAYVWSPAVSKSSVKPSER
jgi:hypothetical protein